MNVLITGSTGFIGGHVKKYLSNIKYQVDTIDREEWTNRELLYKKIGACDVVIHCAWIRDQDLQSIDHMRFALQSIEFINMCKELGKRVINLGSSSEYGVKYMPMAEMMECTPINTYGLAKLTVTLHCKKLGYNTLRLFTVTGKGGHSFYDIRDKVKNASDVFQVRDYISINTVCLAIQRVLHAQHIYGEIINIGSGKQSTNLGVADIHGEYNWNAYPQRQYEPAIWVANVDKMKRLLNIYETKQTEN